jgi:hypothetical protein
MENIKRKNLSPSINAQLRKFASIISKNHNKFNSNTKVGEIFFENDLGENGFVEIYAWKNLPFYAQLLGDKIDEFKIEVLALPSEKEVYNALYHEMLHATDPDFFDDEGWEDYDPEKDISYFGHKLEFRTMTNEFLNALVNVFKEKLKGSNPKSKKKLHDALTNIVNYYFHDEPLKDFAADLLDYSAGSIRFSNNDLDDLMSRIQLQYPGEYTLTTKTSKREKLPIFIRGYLNKIREYNPKQWTDFMSMLLSTQEEILELF